MNRLSVILPAFILGHFLADNARAEAYGSGWYREVQLSVGREDNASRSYKSADLTDDIVATASAGLGYSRNYGEQIRYTLSGYLTYNHFDEFEQLSNIGISLGAFFVFQPNPGYRSVWYTSGAEITRLEYKDSDAREGYLLRGHFALNRRFGLSTTGKLGYRYADLAFLEKSDQDKNRHAAFDVARHEVFIGMDFELTSRVFLTAEYSFQHGGFTSTVSGIPDPSVTYDAETEDPAFQTCDDSNRCSSWYAYRSVSDVHGADIGLAFGAGAMSYDLSARYFDAEGEGGTRYRDWVIQFGLIWTF